MEQSSVLSLDSIDRIRFYVKNKYADLPHEKHAEIVADAIVKIIERQLPDFSAATKKKITNQLIEEVVVPQKRPVSLGDIQLACEACVMDQSEQELLVSWQLEKGIVLPLPENKPALFDMLLDYWTKRRKAIYYGIASLLIIAGVGLYPAIRSMVVSETPFVNDTENVNIEQQLELMANDLPSYYQYISINEHKLKAYLTSRNSILTDEPYFSTIMQTAKDFNIHPVLLFAITGQEQGFVDRSHERAAEIANNPFNVFYSWQDYNTTIEDTVAIAARTIVNLSKDRPAEIDPIVWINRKYAEDPNWSTGVKSLFETIVNYIND